MDRQTTSALPSLLFSCLQASKRRFLDMNRWCLGIGICMSCTSESLKLLLVWPHALSPLHLKHDWSMCPDLVSSRENPLWILSDLFMMGKVQRMGRLTPKPAQSKPQMWLQSWSFQQKSQRPFRQLYDMNWFGYYLTDSSSLKTSYLSSLIRG